MQALLGASADASNTPKDDEYDHTSDDFKTFMDAQENVHTVDDDTQNIDISEPDVYDKYIVCRVIMDEGVNRGRNLVTAKNRAIYDRGHALGTAHNNQMIDTR